MSPTTTSPVGTSTRLAVAEDHGHRRREIEQRADSVVGAAARPHLKPVAEQHERREEGGRLVEHLTLEPEGDRHRVDPPGADGDGDEDHHVQSAVAQGLAPRHGRRSADE